MTETRIELSVLAEAVMALARERGPAKSFCPSEVARQFGPAWRDLMPDTRLAAIQLAAQGKLEILQRGETLASQIPRGPIRLRQPAPRK